MALDWKQRKQRDEEAALAIPRWAHVHPWDPNVNRSAYGPSSEHARPDSARAFVATLKKVGNSHTIVIPKDVRERLRATAGDQIGIIVYPSREIDYQNQTPPEQSTENS